MAASGEAVSQSAPPDDAPASPSGLPAEDPSPAHVDDESPPEDLSPEPAPWDGGDHTAPSEEQLSVLLGGPGGPSYATQGLLQKCAPTAPRPSSPALRLTLVAFARPPDNHWFMGSLERKRKDSLRLPVARRLLDELVGWPDYAKLPDGVAEPPHIEESPHALELLDDFMRHLKTAPPQDGLMDDPFIVLSALRGYTAYAASSPAAEAKRAALEQQVLAQKDSWWVPRPSKLAPDDLGPSRIPSRSASRCVDSADYLRRHPLYAGRPDVYSAWDGQPTPPDAEFHRARLYRLLASVSDRMAAAGLESPNSSGLPDLPYDEVRSFVAPALLHAPDDPFVLLSTLHLLAGAFNTDVRARLHAAELLAARAASGRFAEESFDWSEVYLPFAQAQYELLRRSHDVARPLLGPEADPFRTPMLRTYYQLRAREADLVRATKERRRAREQGKLEHAPPARNAGPGRLS